MKIKTTKGYVLIDCSTKKPLEESVGEDPTAVFFSKTKEGLEVLAEMYVDPEVKVVKATLTYSL